MDGIAFQGLLVLHAAATWWMVGLIWFVQIVHYPLMALVPDDAGRRYAALHQRLTTFVVGPPMLVELAVSIAIVAFAGDSAFWRSASWTGFSLVLLIWMWTFAVVVPVHTRLLSGSSEALARQLVVRNWVRTLAWTLRGVLAAGMLLQI